MDNYVGKRLENRYEVQEIIGVGGMSVVYKAYDNVDDRVVAVKVLKDEFLNNEDFKRRFKNESKAIALLSHNNIVKVYDVNFGEKLQYIVMEYIDGITLKEYINKQGAITWNDALYFMTQILRAVQHAHDKGIVHRDIKPQNIILLPTGEIKVTDFGIARFSRSETKTLTEEAIGTVHYISPEQAKGEHTDEKADIYSLGVVLYEMLAGKVPFEADSAVSVALKQIQENAQHLTDINPDIPYGLEQICNHAMQKNPADRYQTATEMLLDIEEIIKNPSIRFNYDVKIDNNPTRIVPKPIIDEYDEEYEEVPEYKDPDNKKKVITASIIGVIVLVAAIALLVIGFTNGMSTKTHQLENFQGSLYDELISSTDYDYEFIAEYEKSDETPGKVLGQDPEAGTKVLDGSTVKLIVAATKDDTPIPNLYGLNEVLATQELSKQGLVNYRVMRVSSENVEEGKVVYTDPKANTVVSADQEIIIYISSGPSTSVVNTLRVPDVQGLSQSGARAFLEQYGFSNVSFSTLDSDAPKGVVISQSPGVGEEALATDSIKVVISSGVTTTTTEKSVKASFTVKLPKCVDENGNYVKDTIIVKVDGTVFRNQAITLNGKNNVFSVTGDGKKGQNVVVSLKSTGATETKSTNGKNNQSISIDFSGFSYDNTTNDDSNSTNE